MTHKRLHPRQGEAFGGGREWVVAVGEACKGDRCQLKLWEGNEFFSSPQAASTPTTLLSYRSPFWPNMARHPLWLPVVCSVSQWQQLNSFYLRQFSRLLCGKFWLQLHTAAHSHNICVYLHNSSLLKKMTLTYFYWSRTKERNMSDISTSLC